MPSYANKLHFTKTYHFYNWLWPSKFNFRMPDRGQWRMSGSYFCPNSLKLVHSNIHGRYVISYTTTGKTTKSIKTRFVFKWRPIQPQRTTSAYIKLILKDLTEKLKKNDWKNTSTKKIACEKPWRRLVESLNLRLYLNIPWLLGITYSYLMSDQKYRKSLHQCSNFFSKTSDEFVRLAFFRLAEFGRTSVHDSGQALFFIYYLDHLEAHAIL